METWKDIPGYEGYYMASNHGRIKSLQRTVATHHCSTKVNNERILKYQKSRGYSHVKLCKKGIKMTYKVHRLIALTWLGESTLDVNHKDLNKSNNHIDNLEYLSKLDNQRHAISLGRYRRTEVICTQTGRIFESVTIAARFLGLTRKNLCNKIHGRRVNNTTMKLYANSTNA